MAHLRLTMMQLASKKKLWRGESGKMQYLHEKQGEVTVAGSAFLS